MASSLCPFCQHSNPAVAKFCNDCGAPLHLKPCSQCDAINDPATKNCYQCGAELAATPTTTEPAPASSSAEAAASTSSSRGVDFEPTRTPLPESAPETLNAFAARQATRPEVPANTSVGIVAWEDQPLDADLTVPPFAPQGASQMVPLPKLAPAAAEYRRSHAALIAVLIVVVTVSAYYVNRNPAQLKLWLGVSEPDPGVLVTADPGRPPSSSPPAKIGVAPSSSPKLGFGTASAADVRSTTTEESAESTNKVTVAPGNRADTPAAKPHSVNDDAPARPPGPRTEAAKPISPSAIAAEAAHETNQPATSRVDAARPPSGRLTTPPLAGAAALPRQRTTESRGGAPPDALPVSVCTEAVAALGFCNLNAQGENK